MDILSCLHLLAWAGWLKSHYLHGYPHHSTTIVTPWDAKQEGPSARFGTSSSQKTRLLGTVFFLAASESLPVQQVCLQSPVILFFFVSAEQAVRCGDIGGQVTTHGTF